MTPDPAPQPPATPPLTPQTEAGRRLLAFAEWRLPSGETAIARSIAAQLIPAIEAEARALDVEALAQAMYAAADHEPNWDWRAEAEKVARHYAALAASPSRVPDQPPATPPLTAVSDEWFMNNVREALENGYDRVCAHCGVGTSLDDLDIHERACPEWEDMARSANGAPR